MNPGGDWRSLDRFEDEGGQVPEKSRDGGPGVLTEEGNDGDTGRVVVTPSPTGHAYLAHHRDIPELQADGASPREALANLAEDLGREIAGVADHYRRGLFGRVLDDVRAFAASEA